MREPTDDLFPVSEDHLRLERQERRFHRELNGTDYLSWKQLLRRVSPGRRYRVAHFGMPTVIEGEALLALAHATLVDRSCTYIGSVRQVGPEYEIPIEDYWETHTDPGTGRTLVNGSGEKYWDITYFVGAECEEVDEETADRILKLARLSVESIAAEVIARRCAENGVNDPEASAETLGAVRRAMARTLTDDDGQERTMRQLLPRGRGEEVFDRVYGVVRMRRAGLDLDQHPEWRSLEVFYELGVRPPNRRRQTSSSRCSGSRTWKARGRLRGRLRGSIGSRKHLPCEQQKRENPGHRGPGRALDHTDTSPGSPARSWAFCYLAEDNEGPGRAKSNSDDN